MPAEASSAVLRKRQKKENRGAHVAQRITRVYLQDRARFVRSKYRADTGQGKLASAVHIARSVKVQQIRTKRQQ